MNNQMKLDLTAAAATGVMFLGAYALTISRWGGLLIIGGIGMMMFLFVKIVRSPR